MYDPNRTDPQAIAKAINVETHYRATVENER